MYLTTGSTSARWDGSHVVLSVPSGGETVEIAMTLREGEVFLRHIEAACRDGFIERVKESAEVMPFKRPKRRKA
jgi:hypothetical protein